VFYISHLLELEIGAFQLLLSRPYRPL